MKCQLLKRFFFFIAAIILTVSCSKDDPSANEPINQDGGEVFRAQVVTVELPSVKLTQDEYAGKLGLLDLKLIKGDEHKLVFSVPLEAELGKDKLVISGLDNVLINYEVKETVLTETADAITTPLFSNLEDCGQSLGMSPQGESMQKSINSFNSVYENLTQEEKNQVALVYKANKSLIDGIVSNNFANTGKNSNTDLASKVVKFKLSVLGIAAGAVLFELGTHPGIKALGAVIGGASTGFAISNYSDIIDLFMYRVNVTFEKISGVLDKKASTSLLFKSDIDKAISFEISSRKTIASDSKNQNADVVSFFASYNKYNKIMGSINNEIKWVNDNIPFADFDLIPLLEMPQSSEENVDAVDQEIFNNFTFSLSDPNLQLVSSSFQNNLLNLKIKIKNTPSSLPVEAYLNYTYNDELNSFSGKLPIKVDNGELKIGDSYQGGVVAYLYKEGDESYVSGEVHGLIAAASDQSAGKNWSDALQLCNNLVVGGYDDWYLPSQTELSNVRSNKTIVGGFTNGIYWSSTQSPYSENSATCVYFDTSNMVYELKTEVYRVRAIRKF